MARSLPSMIASASATASRTASVMPSPGVGSMCRPASPTSAQPGPTACFMKKCRDSTPMGFATMRDPFEQRRRQRAAAAGAPTAPRSGRGASLRPRSRPAAGHQQQAGVGLKDRARLPSFDVDARAPVVARVAGEDRRLLEVAPVHAVRRCAIRDRPGRRPSWRSSSCVRRRRRRAARAARIRRRRSCTRTPVTRSPSLQQADDARLVARIDAGVERRLLQRRVELRAPRRARIETRCRRGRAACSCLRPGSGTRGWAAPGSRTTSPRPSLSNIFMPYGWMAWVDMGWSVKKGSLSTTITFTPARCSA